MISMTGFGDASRSIDGLEIETRIRGYNAKTLEIRVDLPESVKHLDRPIYEMAKEAACRGSVIIRVYFHITASSDRRLKEVIANSVATYREITKTIEDDKPFVRELSVRLISKIALGLLTEDIDEEAIIGCVRDALDSFVEYRKREGREIKALIDEKLKRLEDHLCEITHKLDDAYRSIEQKLTDQIKRVADWTEVPQPVLYEISNLIERLTVTEELDRIRIHIEEFKRQTNRERCGRALDVISQEIYRELNTTSAKLQHRYITPHIVEMKRLVTDIREQLGNVE